MSRQSTAPSPADLAPPADPTAEIAVQWIDRQTAIIEQIMLALPGMDLDQLARAYCTVMTIHWGLATLVESVPQGVYGNEFSDKANKLQGLIIKSVNAIHARMLELAAKIIEEGIDALEAAMKRFGFDRNKIPPFMPEPPTLDVISL